MPLTGGGGGEIGGFIHKTMGSVRLDGQMIQLSFIMKKKFRHDIDISSTITWLQSMGWGSRNLNMIPVCREIDRNTVLVYAHKHVYLVVCS